MEPVRLFLDTNIVLDYFSGRMNDGLAKKIVQIGRNPRYELCISILTAINVLYISGKTDRSISPDILSELFSILPQDLKQWEDAKELEISDFEDALQVSCALNNNAFFVISRDRHLTAAPIVTLSPEEFIAMVTKRAESETTLLSDCENHL